MVATWMVAALVAGPLAAATSGNSTAPNYSAESIANTAANVAGYFSGYSFLTIYGENLSYSIRALSPDVMVRGQLPYALGNVSVLLNASPALIYFVSPQQVNILAPPTLGAGRVTLQLVREGVAGPPVAITLSPSAPAIFQMDERTVIATHADNSLVTLESPAHPGETIVLWCAGLGPTLPSPPPRESISQPAQVRRKSEFRITLNGAILDPSRVFYVGLSPGFAGLYQVNLRLPDDAPPTPEIRIGYPDQMSPAGRVLPIE